MVLKRLLLTALGALGLGALATGPVLAGDDQIPAPRLYDDIANCMTTAPTSVTRAMGRTPSFLDRLFDEDPTAILSARTLGTGANELNVQDTLLARITNPCNATGSTANDISEGFSEARRLYDRTESRRPLAEAENASQRAIDDFNEAKGRQDLYGGAVYSAIYAEQGSWKSTSAAIDAWNALFDDPDVAGANDGSYTVARTNYDLIRVGGTVLNPDDPDTSDVNENTANVDNPFERDSIKGFQAIGASGSTLSEGATADSITTAVNATGNDLFSASGSLVFAQSITRAQRQNDDDDSVNSTSTIDTLGEVRTHLAAWNAAVAAAQETYDDANPNTVDTAPLLRTLNRLKIGRDHVASELDRLTRVARAVDNQEDTSGDGTVDTRVSTLLNRHQTALGDLNAAERAIRSAAADLEAARNDVKSRLEDPDDYLSQLVRLREYEKQDLLDRYEGDPPESQLEDANEAIEMAMAQQMTHSTLAGADGNAASTLLAELLKPEEDADGNMDDDGLALVNAISSVDSKVGALEDQLTDADGNPIDLSNLGNAEEIATLTTDVSENSDDITALDGRVAENESDIGQIQTDLYGETSGQHGDLAACDATGLLNVANCANARSLHNEADIDEVNDKLMQKKEYIDNLAAEIGVDPVTGEGTGEGGMSRIDMNAKAISDETTARMEADTALGGRIDAEAMARADADTALGGRIDAEAMARADADTALGMRIDGEAMARADADVMLGGMIAAEEMARMEADAALGGRISSNAADIAAAMNSIGSNTSMINNNRAMIGELSDDLDVVRAGVAASMALAGMPAINGRGIAIGVGSYDGESAFAVGFQIQGEQASFKVGVTSSGGETGASAGVGFNF